MNLPPFQSLLDAYRGDVYRFLVASVGPVDADDCFQETWIAALRAYPRLRRADNLRGWLLRIAQNKAIDSQRARARRPRPSESLPETRRRPRGAGGRGRRAGALGRGPAAAAEAANGGVLRSVLGMPYDELAELLDSSEEAARRNVHEGLKSLREEWTR